MLINVTMGAIPKWFSFWLIALLRLALRIQDGPAGKSSSQVRLFSSKNHPAGDWMISQPHPGYRGERLRSLRNHHDILQTELRTAHDILKKEFL